MHFRPLRKKITDDLSAYRFSSYRLYTDAAGVFDVNIQDEIKEVSAIINNANYAEFMNGFKKEDIDQIDNKLSRKRVIGSKEFKKKIDHEVELAKKEDNPAASQDAKDLLINKKIAVAVMLVLIAVLFFTNKHFQKKAVEVKNRQRTEIELRLKQERETLKRNLEERYAADQVSYEAMKKRLDIEKAKIKELEAKK